MKTFLQKFWVLGATCIVQGIKIVRALMPLIKIILKVVLVLGVYAGTIIVTLLRYKQK